MKILKKETYSMTVMITRQCNLDCTYCYVNKQKHLELDMTALKKGILFFLSQPWYNKELTFYGGEILLVDTHSLQELFHFSREVGVRMKKAVNIVVVTNGVLYSEKHWDLFVKYCNEVRLSIDGWPMSQDIDRGNWTTISIQKTFFRVLEKYPEAKNLLSVNKVVSPHNIHTLTEDCMYIIENYLKHLSGRWLSLGTAQAVSWWKERDILLLKTQYYKLEKKLSQKDLIDYCKRLFHIPVWYCFYANLALWYDGRIYNCDYNANRSKDFRDQTYIYDIYTDTINPDLDVDICEYNVKSDRCRNELCALCTRTCTNYDAQNQKNLNEEESGSLANIKMGWRFFHYGTYDKKRIVFLLRNLKWNIRKALNCLSTSTAFLKLDTICIIEENEEDFIQSYSILSRELENEYTLLLEKEIPSWASLCILDLEKEQFFDVNGKNIGNFFNGISYFNII